MSSSRPLIDVDTFTLNGLGGWLLAVWFFLVAMAAIESIALALTFGQGGAPAAISAGMALYLWVCAVLLFLRKAIARRLVIALCAFVVGAAVAVEVTLSVAGGPFLVDPGLRVLPALAIMSYFIISRRVRQTLNG